MQKKKNNNNKKTKRYNKKKNSTREKKIRIFLQKKKKKVCKVMPLRKVPNTEDNEKMDHRFDLSVNDSESHYQLLHYDHYVICAYCIAWLGFSCI